MDFNQFMVCFNVVVCVGSKNSMVEVFPSKARLGKFDLVVRSKNPFLLRELVSGSPIMIMRPEAAE
jgi:hypothetical protein